ncbi:MAG: hypothetical protein UV36_C0031G0001, partial [Parcubacteria group bacterium GW2011_GWC2_42_6]
DLVTFFHDREKMLRNQYKKTEHNSSVWFFGAAGGS